MGLGTELLCGGKLDGLGQSFYAEASWSTRMPLLDSKEILVE